LPTVNTFLIRNRFIAKNYGRNCDSLRIAHYGKGAGIRLSLCAEFFMNVKKLIGVKSTNYGCFLYHSLLLSK
jgi:hypothetical protein